MNIYFLMNGNIFNYSPASEQYSWSCGWGCSHTAYAIPPAPPGNISTITGEPIFVQSYINAYNTAFNQPRNFQRVLYKYQQFTPNDTDGNFVPGTFGYKEYLSQYSITVGPLQDDASMYSGTPYLFISTGSGGGSGFMYLNWIIATYGVPFIISVS
jgi:hypothetical protein